MSYLERRRDAVRYQLTPPSVLIGRSETNDIAFPEDQRMSRRHARIDLQDGQWVISDCASTNGTTVNGQKITTHPLRHGDRVLVGGEDLFFAAVDDPFATINDGVVEPGVDEAPNPALSEREREILALVGKGRTDGQIAEELYISVATVRSHLDRIRDKTGCRRRAELTRLAIELDRR